MTNSIINTANTIDPVEDLVIVPVRESVAVEIHGLLESIGSSYLRIGSLLNEARADFEAQKEFLAWAESEFSIKKAQCYNLMNVSRVFDGNGKFEGVAMRVMLALIPHADDAIIMEKAAELAMDGTLNTAAVNALTGKQAAPKVNPDVAAIAQAQAAQAAPQAPQGVPDEVEGDEAPFDIEAAPANVVHSIDGALQVAAINAAKLDNAANAESERTTALLETIKGLNATIAELQDALNARTSEREARKSAAPMLPQFKSKCLYARLGLSAEQSKVASALKKAKRDLVKLGYGEGHEAYPLIEDAVTELLKEAQATAQ